MILTSRPILESETVAIDLAQIDAKPGLRRYLSWRSEKKPVWTVRFHFESSGNAMELSYSISKQQRLPTTSVKRRILLRYARLRYGRRPFFVCPKCSRSCRIVYLVVAAPEREPACRTCIGGRYLNDVYRRHPGMIRRRALRQIHKAEELLARPHLGAAQRARALDLLEEGARLGREHRELVIAHAVQRAGALEAVLDDAQEGAA